LAESPFWQMIRDAMAGNPPPPRAIGIGMTLRHRDCRPGHFEGEIEFEHGAANAMGIIHGGFVATVLDIAMGYASLTLLEESESQRTLEMKINFLDGVPPDRVRVEGDVVRHGHRIAYCEGSVRTAGGTLVARASATFSIRRAGGGKA
jgi:uncharacterized protein (TIGR00369 family)